MFGGLRVSHGVRTVRFRLSLASDWLRPKRTSASREALCGEYIHRCSIRARRQHSRTSYCKAMSRSELLFLLQTGRWYNCYHVADGTGAAQASWTTAFSWQLTHHSEAPTDCRYMVLRQQQQPPAAATGLPRFVFTQVCVYPVAGTVLQMTLEGMPDITQYSLPHGEHMRVYTDMHCMHQATTDDHDKGIRPCTSGLVVGFPLEYVLKPLQLPDASEWVPMFFSPGQVPKVKTNNTPNPGAILSDPLYDIQHMYCCRASHPANEYATQQNAFIKAMMDRNYQGLRHREKPSEAHLDALSRPGLIDKQKLEYGNHIGLLVLPACQEASKRDHGAVTYKLVNDVSIGTILETYHSASMEVDAEFQNQMEGNDKHPVADKFKAGKKKYGALQSSQLAPHFRVDCVSPTGVRAAYTVTDH